MTATVQTQAEPVRRWYVTDAHGWRAPVSCIEVARSLVTTYDGTHPKEAPHAVLETIEVDVTELERLRAIEKRHQVLCEKIADGEDNRSPSQRDDDFLTVYGSDWHSIVKLSKDAPHGLTAYERACAMEASAFRLGSTWCENCLEWVKGEHGCFEAKVPA